jgi:hypothetical protein
MSLITFSLSAALALSCTALALPLNLSDPSVGPIPGESSLYSDYRGKAPPFPANQSAPVPATATGPPGPDDLLFQNLLSAEWAVYSLYQQAVEAFNTSSFTDLGLPNTTYSRVAEIRDNEAGHLRIFQDSISPNSLKPGACKYDFGFDGDAESWLELQVSIEVGSMAFLTGLVQQSNTAATSGALVAIAETESRHNAWSLIAVFNVDPFAGPADTTFPYANQVLDLTNQFIVPGSCPKENPVYPTPSQHLPLIRVNDTLSGYTGGPGSPIQFTYHNTTGASVEPDFHPDKHHFAVYFHGVNNISVPFGPKAGLSKIPAQFEGKGIIVLVIADEEGAPTEESVIAGPLILVQQPAGLAKNA